MENNDIMTPEELVHACKANNDRKDKQVNDNLEQFKNWFNNVIHRRIKRGDTFSTTSVLMLFVDDIPDKFLDTKIIRKYLGGITYKTYRFKQYIIDYLHSRGWGIPHDNKARTFIALTPLENTNSELPF